MEVAIDKAMESQSLINICTIRCTYPPSPPIHVSEQCKNHVFLLLLFVFKMKTGPFAEHSNVLWGISSVKMWDKVNSGLIKMYKAEVYVNS